MASTPPLAVLLVASDPAVAGDIARMLRALNFEPVMCASPEAARAQARTRHAELAVVDLPGQLDVALDLIGRLRADGVSSVIVASDGNGPGASDRHTGPAGMLARPFTSAHLECVLHVVRQLARVDALADAAARLPVPSELEEQIRVLASSLRASTVTCGAGGGAHCVYPGLDLLSPREAEIARWLLQGQRVPAISRRLTISPHTVRNHIKAMFRKFGVHSQAELVDRLMGQHSTAV